MRGHRYTDMSNLNAPYDAAALGQGIETAPPAYRYPHRDKPSYDVASLYGLGASGMHLYYDVSDLNAPYDQIPMQGLGAGSIAAGSLGSLGAVASEYPWKEYSTATLALQSEINAWLKEHGYCPIGADGKLGPTTCGAAAFYRDESGYGGAKNIAGGVPSTCQSFSFSPKTPPCASAVPAPSPTPAPLPAAPAPTPATASISGGGDWMWIAIGGLVAAGAIGAAIYYKKRRR